MSWLLVIFIIINLASAHVCASTGHPIAMLLCVAVALMNFNNLLNRITEEQ